MINVIASDTTTIKASQKRKNRYAYYVFFVATRMFTGIGEAGYMPAGYSLVGDSFADDQRTRVISWLSIAGLVGPILGMVLGGVIAGLAPGSWRWAFLATGIPGLLLAFLAWRLHEPPPPAGRNSDR